MAAIILGYTFSCLILFGSADAPFFVSSVNYYLVLCSGILLITLWYFSLLAVCGVIIMNIMVGCTFIVLTLLFIFDGNLQYAYVNNWRRIRNDDFRYALCFPHLEVVGEFYCICKETKECNNIIFRLDLHRPLVRHLWIWPELPTEMRMCRRQQSLR